MNELCQVCFQDHRTPERSCDYEECDACGFDHEYEPVQARDHHRSMSEE